MIRTSESLKSGKVLRPTGMNRSITCIVLIATGVVQKPTPGEAQSGSGMTMLNDSGIGGRIRHDKHERRDLLAGLHLRRVRSADAGAVRHYRVPDLQQDKR